MRCGGRVTLLPVIPPWPSYPGPRHLSPLPARTDFRPENPDHRWKPRFVNRNSAFAFCRDERAYALEDELHRPSPAALNQRRRGMRRSGIDNIRFVLHVILSLKPWLSHLEFVLD